MKNRNRYIIIGITTVMLIAIVVFFVGSSLGFFRYVKEGEVVNVVTLNGIQVEITNPEDDALNLENAYPVSDSDGLSNTPFTFTMTNTSSRSISYSIVVENDEEKQAACVLEDNSTVCPKLTTDYIRYSYLQEDGTYSEPKTLADTNNVITSGVIQGKETVSTSIILWISSEAGNEVMNHYFFGKLIVTGEQLTESTFKDIILKNNKIISAQPTLTTSSNNTSDASGLYMSTLTNTKAPTYYFRGDVENNYVEFAEQTWRIVRINEDGTVRLMMSDGINDNTKYAFNATNYDTYQYMYYSGSEIKAALEAWYQTNIEEKGYSYNVATGNYFCEEARVKKLSEHTSGNATMNLYNDSTYVPTFSCENDGNNKGKINSNIGLITYEEVLYSGGYIDQENTEYYLCNETAFWTMSPAGSSSDTYVWNVRANCSLNNGIITNTRILRPVINLKASVIVTGTGTNTDPYKIKIQKDTSLTIGQSVTAIDGSKWHVLEASSSDSEYVTLLSDYNLNSDGSYNTECGIDVNGSHLCGVMAFDINSTNVYDETDSNNIGYFIKNTYVSKVTKALPGTTNVTLPEAEQIALADGQTFENVDLTLRSSWLATTSYWTKTDNDETTNTVWKVTGNLFSLSDNFALIENSFGARPVITTLKTNLVLN